MKLPPSVRAVAIASSLGGVACGAYQRDGDLPTAPAALAVPASPFEIVMESSQGVAPAGFELVSHTDPKADEGGVIRAESPLTVAFDLCGSTVNDGGHPWFLFDFDFDHVPDVIGKAESCRQTRTYRLRFDADQDALIAANFCLANADPSVRKPGTYFSCRSVRIALPHFAGAKAGCYTFDDGRLSFLWPGGLGPVAPRVFSDAACARGAMFELGQVVAARDEGEARRRCGSARVSPVAGPFFACSPV